MLQIIGSAAFLFWALCSAVFTVAGFAGIIDPYYLWTPRGSWLRIIATRMLWLAGVFFPVGFLWHALRFTRRT
jgi:hypothetical protein